MLLQTTFNHIKHTYLFCSVYKDRTVYFVHYKHMQGLASLLIFVSSSFLMISLLCTQNKKFIAAILLSAYFIAVIFAVCRRFPLRLKGVVYVSYERPAILYGSEAWCLKESEIGILQWTEKSIVRAMYGIQLKIEKDLQICFFMMVLNKTIHQLAMASNVLWYGHVFRRALNFEVDGQRKKRGLKRT